MRNKLQKLLLFSICFSSLINPVLAKTPLATDPTMDGSLAAGFTGIFGLSMVLMILSSILCYCIPILIGLVFLAIWVWMLVDVLQRDEKDFGPGTNNKVMWILVVLLTNTIGAVVYYFMIYTKFKKG